MPYKSDRLFYQNLKFNLVKISSFFVCISIPNTTLSILSLLSQNNHWAQLMVSFI